MMAGFPVGQESVIDQMNQGVGEIVRLTKEGLRIDESKQIEILREMVLITHADWSFVRWLVHKAGGEELFPRLGKVLKGEEGGFRAGVWDGATFPYFFTSTGEMSWRNLDSAENFSGIGLMLKLAGLKKIEIPQGSFLARFLWLVNPL